MGRAPANDVFYVLSHFVAITSWVIAMETVRDMPRDLRTSYYFGLGSTSFSATWSSWRRLPARRQHCRPSVSAGLFLLTPMYFLTSLWGSARERAAHIAMVLGLVSRPGAASDRAGIRSAWPPGCSAAALPMPSTPVTQDRRGMTLGSIDAWWWPFVFILIAGWLDDRSVALRSASISAAASAKMRRYWCWCAPSRPRWWRRSSAI